MSTITIKELDGKVMMIFPNTKIITVEEFKKYPGFCPVDENGDMYPDIEHDFTKLARIYEMNDFEADEFEDCSMGFILLFSEEDEIISSRVMGYGSDTYREKMDKLFYG